jgi:DNA-binding response OmpR family regulator
MPYYNGDEILKIVREEQQRNTPIIMISSDTAEEVVALALKQGVAEFIKKPVDAATLRVRLKKYLS